MTQVIQLNKNHKLNIHSDFHKQDINFDIKKLQDVAPEGSKAILGSILDRFEQLVRQNRCPGQADAMAGVLDPRNGKFDIKITWTCPDPQNIQPNYN